MGAREVFFLPTVEGNHIVEVSVNVIGENGGQEAMVRRLAESDQTQGRFLIEKQIFGSKNYFMRFRFSDEYTAFVFKLWYG